MIKIFQHACLPAFLPVTVLFVLGLVSRCGSLEPVLEKQQSYTSPLLNIYPLCTSAHTKLYKVCRGAEKRKRKKGQRTNGKGQNVSGEMVSGQNVSG